MKHAVLILGVPSSGNRLWHALFKAAGADYVGVYHFGTGFERHIINMTEQGWDVRAIMPIRDDTPLMASLNHHHQQLLEAHTRGFGTFEEGIDMHYRETAKVLARHRLPVFPVRYEDLVADPDGVGREVCEWAGYEFPGWPEPIVDGNAKYALPAG